MGISLLLAFPSAIAPPLHITQNIDDLSLQLLYLWLQQPLDLHLNARIAIKTWLLVLQAWIRASPCGVIHCINLKNFINIRTDKLPRCGGHEWLGSSRFGRCGDRGPASLTPHMRNRYRSNIGLGSQNSARRSNLNVQV